MAGVYPFSYSAGTPPLNSSITGTPNLSTTPTGYDGGQGLAPAIQTIWSKEILFQAMPILRFEQFAVKKTELGVAPGLQINFMRYINLPVTQSPLVEGVRMETKAITAEQYSITVTEHGYAVAVSELLLNASFDDVMASASRLLGRNMALYLDIQARDTLLTGTSQIFGYTMGTPPGAMTMISPYDPGTPAADAASLDGTHYLRTGAVKDAVETLASKNVPRLGETYVCFVHPHQSRRLRDTPEFIEVTKYAAPGNFMLGEIGRLYDAVFIETTQIKQYADADHPGAGTRYDALMIGDNAFGHAISLPVELRDGGIIDFGREHALAWYAIWGLGKITDDAIVTISTN
jgi:N4-gp56 family major capsid protein